MSKTNISLWSTTAASNTDVGGVTLAENVMLPSGVNNSVREAMSELAKFYADLGGVNTVGGTGDAVTITTAETFTALASGLIVTFKASAANTTAATVNVDGLGVKAIRRQGDTALSANDILASGFYILRYSSTYNAAAGAWVLLNPAGASAGEIGATIDALTGKTTPVDADEWVLSDSAASNVGKKVTGTNHKAYLKTYFDTLYTALKTILTTLGNLANASGVLTNDGAGNLSWAASGSGGVTALGTINTNSGSTFTLSSLTLTTYKFLYCVINGTSLSGAGNLTQNGVIMFTLAGAANAVTGGLVIIDLTNGIGVCTGTVTGGSAAPVGYASGLSTASTAISFAASAGTGDAGSILVYGVK